MAVTTFASGTQSATVTTEHFLTSPNVAATYVFGADMVNMLAGDTVELRVYKMGLTSGTQRVYIVQIVNFSDVNADSTIWQSIPVSTALTDTNALRFSLKQTTGTSRNFPWWAEKYA